MSLLHIRVAWAAPAAPREISIELPAPVTLQMAIDAAIESVPEIAPDAKNAAAIGVWGKLRAPDYRLRDGDRVELYRALQADPKEARRANARRAPGKTKKM